MQNSIVKKYKLKLYFNICLGIFLFILFFQPFNINFDINNQLIFIAGLSLITFLSLLIVNVILPISFPRVFDFQEWEINPEFVIYSLIVVINSTAFAFYLGYVGNVPVTFYLVFKIGLISIIPLIVLKINSEHTILLQRIKSLEENREDEPIPNENLQDKNSFETFYSENKSEKLEIELNNVIMINSADNYVKIVYKENNEVCNKLIRNTLKNIEEQLKIHTDFIRCHRSCIINIVHVENLNRSYKGYRIKINDIEEEIPVSLQYILKVREILGHI